MAEIIPIKGIRFNQPSDLEQINEQQGAENFNRWLNENKLTTEEKPVLYFYQQQYHYQGESKNRNGFVCGVKLEPYDKGIILPHQELLPAQSEQQLAQLKACQANITPVLGLYADFSFNLNKLVQQAAGSTVDFRFTDANGVTHSLTAINDNTVIQQVQQEMERQRIFIAGGHHSYDAALRYYQENPAAKYITMALMNLYDPNLLILPMHRLVKDVPEFKVNKFIKELNEDFIVEEFAVDPNGDNMQEFLQTIYHKGGFDQGLGLEHRRIFGLYTGNGHGYLLRLAEMSMDRLMPTEGYSLALQGLDVFVLHYTILERLLGIGKKIDPEEAKKSKNKVKPGTVTYTREEAAALKKVDSGEYQLAFYLNPMAFDEFTAVAIGGEKTPPKSTHFYPQIPVGLVMMPVQ